MTTDKFLDQQANPDYQAITGSRLYGYDTPESDIDLRGFFLPPHRYRHSLPGLTVQQISGPGDCILYNVKDYIYLVAGGNTSLLEILYAPPSMVKHQSIIGDIILSKRDLFLSKTFYRSIRGYALSEFRKAQAVELKENSADNKTKLFIDFCSAFQLTGPERNDILADLQKNHPDFQPFTEIPAPDKLGERRRAAYDAAGYCPKNAAHCLRLLSQGIELMTDHRLTFPRHDAKFLKNVRDGVVPWDIIKGRYEELNVLLDEAAAKSTIPQKCDMDKVNEVYLSLVNY